MSTESKSSSPDVVPSVPVSTSPDALGPVVVDAEAKTLPPVKLGRWSLFGVGFGLAVLESVETRLLLTSGVGQQMVGHPLNGLVRWLVNAASALPVLLFVVVLGAAIAAAIRHRKLGVGFRPPRNLEVISLLVPATVSLLYALVYAVANR